MVWWLTRRHAGVTLRQIGERSGGSDYAAVSVVLKRFEKKPASDAALRSAMKKLEETMLP